MTTTAERLNYREAMSLAHLPEFTEEGVEVRRLVIDPDRASLERTLASFSSTMRGRFVPEGTYTQLYVDGHMWMSDTPDEMRDHLEPFWKAQELGGRILVNGLGSGMILGAFLKLPNVEHIDVVEKDERVARLIGRYYDDERVTIHVADALHMAWPTGSRWTMAWHDIWLHISAENLDDMKRLHRKYGRRVQWQASWARYQCERERGADKRWYF